MSFANRFDRGESPLADGLHLATYAMAGTFLFVNRRIPWLWLIGLGGGANLAAISANGGVMPASPRALIAAGRAVDVHHFANSAAVASPTAIATFSVPGRRPRSCEPPNINGSIGVPRRR